MYRATAFCAVLLLLSGSAFALRAEEAKTGEAKKTESKGKFDMSPYKTLAEDALKLVKAGDMPGALKKMQELEKKFDDGTKDLKAADRKVWKTIDVQMDVGIDACKGEKPDAEKATKAINDFIEKLALADGVK